MPIWFFSGFAHVQEKLCIATKVWMINTVDQEQLDANPEGNDADSIGKDAATDT